MSQEDEGGAVAGSRTPPYVGYKTFLTLLEDLKTHTVPPRIDRSVLKRFSGGVGNQLMMAMKSLGLITEDNKPTARLAEMVDAYGTPAFQSVLSAALAYGYPFLSSIDLKTATPSMLAEAFKNATGAKEDVLAKCRRFFLQAAQEAGIEIGPRILNGGSAAKAPRAAAPASPAPPKRRAAKEKPQRVTEEEVVLPPQPLMTQLVAKYPTFDPAWPEAVQTAWFAGFQKLMEKADK